MQSLQSGQFNLSAPNLVNICIDETCNGELRGQLYHCYDKEPTPFFNVVEMVKKIDALFDAISFPQASTRTRSFVQKPAQEIIKYSKKVVEPKDVIQHKGLLCSFILFVKFRQNSTWQGEVYWLESNSKTSFSNTLDFIKLLDHSISSLQK